MSWNYDAALEAAQTRYEQMAEVTVTDVVREIDFDLISRKHPRRLTGTHMYAEIANFNRLLAAEAATPEEMLRCLHIVAREISKVVTSDFDGFKVHFQGPRVHVVAYRPVADAAEMAVKATLMMLAVKCTVGLANEVLELSGDNQWQVAAAADHGRALATRSGAGGDQESLFLGTPANHAAKTLSGYSVRVTEKVASLLPDSITEHMYESGSQPGVYVVSMDSDTVEALSAEHGWIWTAALSRTRLETRAVSFPPGCVTVSTPQTSIDKDLLQISNTKQVWGVSIFADVDGFTSLIDDLVADDPSLSEDDMMELVRSFHVLRGRMRDTAVKDFSALRIQYQGDRMQAFAYQPLGATEEVVVRAVELASVLKTTAEEILPEVVDPDLTRPLAIGLASGDVLLSRMGERGDPDVVTVGTSAAKAAAVQQRLDGGVIGLCSETYQHLPAWLAQAFRWSSSAKAYTCADLTHERFCDLKASEDNDPGLHAAAGGLGTAAVGPSALMLGQDGGTSRGLTPWARG